MKIIPKKRHRAGSYRERIHALSQAVDISASSLDRWHRSGNFEALLNRYLITRQLIKGKP